MKKIIFIALLISTAALGQSVGPGPLPGVTGPTSATSGHLATFNGTSGKIIQDGGIAAPPCSAFGSTAGTCAQGNDSRLTHVTWSLGNSVTQSYSASSITVASMDTNNFDSASVCDVSTNKGRCTPTTAGKYQISCGEVTTLTTGAALGSTQSAALILKNGAIVYQISSYAAVAALVGPATSVGNSATVSVNGTTDFITCGLFSQGTAPVTTASITANFFTGSYVGP